MSLPCRTCLKILLRQLRHGSGTSRAIRNFSILNRPQPAYEGHIPLTLIERVSMAVGSGVGAYLDPRRGGTQLKTMIDYAHNLQI